MWPAGSAGPTSTPRSPWPWPSSGPSPGPRSRPTWWPRCWGRSSGARSSTSSTTTPSPASRRPSTSPGGARRGGRLHAVLQYLRHLPRPYFGSSMVGPLIDQIVGTAFLLMFVLALTDERNQPPKANLAPLLIGLAVAAIGMSFGANAGYAINPARDFGPRFFAWLVGWGQVAFPGAHGYFWVPIVGPVRRGRAR